MSESEQVSRSVADDGSAAVPMSSVDRTGASVPKREMSQSAGVPMSSVDEMDTSVPKRELYHANRTLKSDRGEGVTRRRERGTVGVKIDAEGEKGVTVMIGAGCEKGTGMAIGAGGEKAARRPPGGRGERARARREGGGAGDERCTRVKTGAGDEKSGGVTVAGQKCAVGFTIGAGKGLSKGLGAGKNARGAAGGETSAEAPMGAGDDKPVGKPQVSVGVSIPDSVVAPLIGAGANVYIMTNELTQSMREKLGTSWPFVQDRLNSRYVKLLAGGLLASVAVILVWKIIKRFTAAKAAKPDDEEDEPCEWTTKTYELTPVSDGKRRSSKSEGDGPDSLHLPAKIQLRVAEAPVQATKTAEPEICKCCGLQKRPM